MSNIPDKDVQAFAEAGNQAQGNVVSEFLAFFKHNKKWWLLPIILLMLLFGVVLVVGGSAAAPFIYSIF